ncbi:NusA antitermination factor [Thermocrinis albus DSM 14484]|uniref:Transcription termination/antitermination protein NusA n=1 Tax=Thermocrinis albus (strain DSM 14484 / JCM 11386 / HI 11/12) TaxID=638303 RepID=D3SM22_THEAH|nr:transcription termination factor NusA [Thermocrinis albus]ADC89802.1 NusA antitermination factor [Thermocrinis albus DSM 14484]
MVKNLRRLIEQVAKEKNLPEWLVERALRNSIALAVKKSQKIREDVEVQLEDDHIKAYLVRRSKDQTIKLPIDIEPADMDRIAAYAAKEEFLKELERAEEERSYLEFVELEGEIVVGIVRKVQEDGDLLVDLGKVMGVLPKKEQIPKEHYKVGDRLRALLLEVRKRRGKYEIILSRTHPRFLKKLLEAEVPEIKEGYIKVEAIAREPGERAKVLVSSTDSRMDPVGVVVGVRGSKIAPITEELSGERIDVIKKSDSVEELIKRSLAPAPVSAVRLFPEEKRAEVAVPKEKLSLAIGKGGVNVRLASKITGWRIDVYSEEDFEKLTKMT